MVFLWRNEIYFTILLLYIQSQFWQNPIKINFYVNGTVSQKKKKKEKKFIA